MIIHGVSFIKSSASIKQCPAPEKPEFGFTGRSNVGKSSLINILTGRKKLSKISASPGKTKTINHFLINNNWYIVDLPGYGYAKAPASMRTAWNKAVREYILKRETLMCIFVLLDSRHKPQNSDLNFMEYLGMNNIPFARIFTKSDKLSLPALEKSVNQYNKTMLEKWESLPSTFVTSAFDGRGRDEILNFIEKCINNFSKTF